jgi:hypothetical protein
MSIFTHLNSDIFREQQLGIKIVFLLQHYFTFEIMVYSIKIKKKTLSITRARIFSNNIRIKLSSTSLKNKSYQGINYLKKIKAVINTQE